MLRSLALALVLLAPLACASRGPSRSQAGTYRFAERLNEASPPVTIEGTVTIAGGLAELDLHSRLCRSDERSSSSFAIFDCGDVSVSVDVRMYRASYSVATMRRYTVRECVEYRTTREGTSVCVRYATRYEERPARLSGRLNLIRDTP